MDNVSDKTRPEYVPMDFGDVLGKSISYWIKNLKSFWILYFAFQITFVTLGYGILFLSGSNYIVAELTAFLGVIFSDALLVYLFPNVLIIVLIVILVVIVLINIIIQTLLGGMVVQHTADHHLKLTPTLSESYASSRSRIWSLVGAQILIIVITLGIFFGGIGLAVLTIVSSIFLFYFSPLIIVAVVIGAIGSVVLMMILLVYVMTRLALVIPSIILAETSAVEGIRDSWGLVKGNWWRTFGVTFIIGLLSMVVSLPLTIGSIFLTWPFMLPSVAFLVIPVIVIISAVITGFTAPLGTTTSTMIYHDLMGRQSMEYKPLKPQQYLAQTKRLHQHTFCPVCKEPVAPNDRFCEKCGRNLTID